MRAFLEWPVGECSVVELCTAGVHDLKVWVMRREVLIGLLAVAAGVEGFKLMQGAAEQRARECASAWLRGCVPLVR